MNRIQELVEQIDNASPKRAAELIKELEKLQKTSA